MGNKTAQAVVLAIAIPPLIFQAVFAQEASPGDPVGEAPFTHPTHRADYDAFIHVFGVGV